MPVTAEPSYIICNLNHLPVSFQIDSGASISTLSYKDAFKINARIKPSTRLVHAYNGESIELLGETNVHISYNNVSFLHTLFVVSNNKVNLLGRDICTKLNIQFLLPDAINFTDDFLSDFREYFNESYSSNVKQSVKLEVDKNASPIYVKPRQIPTKLRDRLKSELDRLVNEGKITQVFQSKWASPIVTVFKKDGSLRLVGDYKSTVNKYLNPVQTPLPTVDETINRVGKATIFSKIDLSQAFLQLPLHQDSKQYTVINTPVGLYQYNYLPFGLTASPGIFQSFITETLSHINNIIIYQDDVLILTRDRDSHLKVLREVLTTLRGKGIKLNVKKCKFMCSEVDYLGHIFDRQGVHPNPDKIKSILDAPAPGNVKQLQAFLGLCNYYSRFLPNFSHAMAPLYLLLKSQTSFQWTAAQQECFNSIKQSFITNNVLQHYDPDHQLKLETDSSGYGLGAVIMSRPDDDSSWLPIQFASRTLNAAERNYSNIEREALSVIFGLEKFKHMLLGSRFIICNDQRPLMKLFGRDKPIPSSCSARIQRWALKLSQFNYTFVYSPGKENVTSDLLSRLPLPETVVEVEPYEIVCSLQSLEGSNITCKDIQIHTNSDPDLVLLKSYIKHGSPHKIVNPTLSKIKSIIPDLTIAKQCIMYKERVFIPTALRSKILNMFHENHPGIVAMKTIARSLIWYPGLDADIHALVLNCKVCQSVRSKPATSNIMWPVPSRPWSRVHIDHFFYENAIFLVVVDALTKYLEVEIVKSTNTSETIDNLSMIFARNGLPDTLVSDNATSFTSYEFVEFLTRNGIKHLSPSPYNPSGNGQAERGVRTVKDMLKKNGSSDSLKYRLAKVLFQYRCTPHNLTQIAPSVSLNNRKLITVKDKLNPHFCSINNDKVITEKKIPQFELGSNVLALNVRGGQKWLRATVVERVAINIYNVHVDDLNVIWKRHVNQLLKIPDSRSDGELNDQLQPDPTSEVPNRQSCRNRHPPDRLTYN